MRHKIWCEITPSSLVFLLLVDPILAYFSLRFFKRLFFTLNPFVHLVIKNGSLST